MVSVTIAGETRQLAEVAERWINKSINRPKSRGLPVCAMVVIKDANVNLRLRTPGCDGGGAAGRRPNRHEKEILLLWSQRGLDTTEFRGGNLVAFLKQLEAKLT